MWRSWLKRHRLKICDPSGKQREFDPHHQQFLQKICHFTININMNKKIQYKYKHNVNINIHIKIKKYIFMNTNRIENITVKN